jgi:hypothetical protein
MFLVSILPSLACLTLNGRALAVNQLSAQSQQYAPVSLFVPEAGHRNSPPVSRPRTSYERVAWPEVLHHKLEGLAGNPPWPQRQPKSR